MSSARDAVLGRVRSALGDTAVPPDVARDYRPAGAGPADVDLFCERVADYCATVHLAPFLDPDGERLRA